MPRRRRSEVEIEAAILYAILDEEKLEDIGALKSRVQARVYVNWHAFNIHLNKLRERALLRDDCLELTDRGRDFLKRYAGQVRDTLSRFGY